MTLRFIEADRAEDVVSLFDQYRIFYEKESDPAGARAFLKERLAKKESVIIAAYATIDGKETAVGFTQLYPGYSSVRMIRFLILNDLYVLESYRKKGIGEALIREAIAYSNEQQVSFLQLETAVNNYNAQHLYETIGFVRQEPDTGFYVYRYALGR